MAAYRPRSPPRRYPDPRDPRASTGTIIASSFDTRPPRYDRVLEAQPVARQNYIDNGYERGPTSRTQYVVRPRHNSFMGDENRRSPNASVDPRSRAAGTTNTGRERPRSPPPPAIPKVHRPRDESDRFLHPSAVSARQDYNHQRHHSATPADMDRLIVASKGGKERGGYHRDDPGGQKRYPPPATRPAIRLDDGYSYTGPREQFERDYPATRSPQRRESQARRERPASALDFPDFKPPSASRRDMPPPSAGGRQFEKIERLDPNRPIARTGGDSDFDRAEDFPKRRHSVRKPEVHQTRGEDYPLPKDDFDGKRSSRHIKARYDDEDHPRAREHVGRDREHLHDPWTNEPRRHHRSRENSPDRGLSSKSTVPGPDSRRAPRSRDNSPERSMGTGLAPPSHESRRKPRSRDSSPERSGIGKGLAVAGLGGLAAAGLATGMKKEKDSREKDDSSSSEARRERRRRRRAERKMREENGANIETTLPRDKPPPHRDDTELANGRREYLEKDNQGSDSQDNHRKHRRHRKSSRSDKELPAEDGFAEVGPGRVPPAGPRDLEREEMPDPDEDSDRRRRRQLEYQGRDRDLLDQSLETRKMSPGENEDDRPRRVQLVEPVKDKEQEIKPRGILKPARQVPFPEDPHPTREGVAPLKEPGKDLGLPEEAHKARWTKISRMLVNPEALEQAKERFEERDDYVIVLRVISKEDIAKLAEKTREIREARELEWQEELDRRRRAEKKAQSHRDSSDDDSETEEEKPRLAIGPPQPYPPAQAAPIDLRAYQTPQDPLSRNVPVDPRAYQTSQDPLSRNVPIDPRAYQTPQDPLSRNVPIDPRGYQSASDPLGRSMPEAHATPVVNAVPDSYSSNV